jgi:hypothetical protein
MIAALCLYLLCSWTSAVPTLCETLAHAEEDWTDTGVGCTDDCLDPMIQDEAQTTTSQRRAP